MSVKQYVDSMVQDCASEIISILGDVGPLNYFDLRRALRMEKHVAQAIIDRALNLAVGSGKVCADGRDEKRIYALAEVAHD